MSVKKVSEEHHSGPARTPSAGGLHARRRRNRRRASIALLVLALALIGAAWWGIWQNTVRVSHVTIFGSTSSLIALAQAEMSGTYFGVIPRDSIFFIPAHDIRMRILASDARVASVSIFREGFTGISIKINERTAIARWCGATFVATRSDLVADCFLFDASGFIFNIASSSDQALTPFNLYAPLDLARGELLAASTSDSLVVSGVEPLRATIADANALPAAFDLARQIGTFGSPVSDIVIRGDEADDLLASGTRVTYVLGTEQDAFTALTSAKSNLNLADGSLEYVDLRFPGKVYLKKKGS